MTDITKLAQELYEAVQFQRTPTAVTDGQLCRLVRKAIRRVWLDTGRTMQYSDSMFQYLQPE